MPQKPRYASIDNCETCLYWERLKRDREYGQCDIITNDQKYLNDIAYISSNKPAVFVARWDFHCTLYKVRT